MKINLRDVADKETQTEVTQQNKTFRQWNFNKNIRKAEQDSQR